MLYDPARHEALTDTAWDEARARAAIAVISADVDASFDEQALWPRHPLDDRGAPGGAACWDPRGDLQRPQATSPSHTNEREKAMYLVVK